MSVVVTLTVNSAMKALVFDADDYRTITSEGNESLVQVFKALKQIATVRDWSAVSIDPTPPDALSQTVALALNGPAAPCEKCEKREERLADSLARQSAKAARHGVPNPDDPRFEGATHVDGVPVAEWRAAAREKLAAAEAKHHEEAMRNVRG